MQQFVEEYTRALTAHLGTPTGDALDRAVALGLEAAERGFGISDLAALHHEAVVAALLDTAGRGQPEVAPERFGISNVRTVPSNGNGAPRRDAIKRVAEFFAMSLAPIWEAQRQLLSEHCALVRLNEVREQEARRIGQALHDEAAQLLAAVHMAVEAVARELESPQRERLRAVRGLLDRVEDQLRSVSHELRPMVLDHFGLQAALKALGDTASQRTGIRVVVDVSIASPLPFGVETALYRIVQEALNNCTRHARATLVTVTVREHGKTISCRVKDDGAGFDVQETVNRKGGCGLGLVGIRERLASLGGALSIQSAPGRGTELVASIRSDAEFMGACAARCPDHVDSQAARCA